MRQRAENVADSATSWIKSPILAIPALLFGLGLLYTFGMLPAVQNYLKTKTLEQKIITLTATANASTVAEKAKKDAIEQEAEINKQKAEYSDRLAHAIATKTAREAENEKSIAFFSPQLQQALTDIEEQKAAITKEQAQEEQRRAKAEAEKRGHEARLLEAQQRINKATIDYRTAEQAMDALGACMNRTATQHINEMDWVSSLTAYRKNYAVYRRYCSQLFAPPPSADRPFITVLIPLTLPEKCTDHWNKWINNPRLKGVYVVNTKLGECYGNSQAPNKEQAVTDAHTYCKRHKWNDCQIVAEK